MNPSKSIYSKKSFKNIEYLYSFRILNFLLDDLYETYKKIKL